jgi:dTDP-4-dehydrorhamnose 3,5-epimerase
MKFKDVRIFTPSCYSDYRGDLWTIWKKEAMLPGVNFIHDKVSISRKNVLRGIHGDYKSSKLISCLHGEIYLVVVDNRPDSSTYLEWDWIILSGKNRKTIFLPPGFGNGFYVLSKESVFYYKWAYEGDYPDVNDQFTIKWNDDRLKIDWPTNNPILQKRDK